MSTLRNILIIANLIIVGFVAYLTFGRTTDGTPTYTRDVNNHGLHACLDAANNVAEVNRCYDIY